MKVELGLYLFEEFTKSDFIEHFGCLPKYKWVGFDLDERAFSFEKKPALCGYSDRIQYGLAERLGKTNREECLDGAFKRLKLVKVKGLNENENQ